MTSDLFADVNARLNEAAEEQLKVGRALVRRNDPATSKAAAARAKRWIPTHEEMILGVLWRPMIALEIGKLTGLTVVQVDRRMPELQSAGRVRLTGKERDGFREWEKA